MESVITICNYSGHRKCDYGFYCAMHFSAKRGIAIVSRPSVTIRYRDHIGWNSSNIISRLNSLRPLLWLTPTWAIWCKGKKPQNWGRIGVGSGAQKTWNISETVHDRTKFNNNNNNNEINIIINIITIIFDVISL